MNRYKFTKLTKRTEPENLSPPMVADGESIHGIAQRISDKTVKELESGEAWCALEIAWENQEEIRPRINQPMRIQGVFDYIRTSCVKSYYVHDDADNHPDKLVLPSNFPIQDIGELPEMKKGDVLIATMNSIYFAQLGE